MASFSELYSHIEREGGNGDGKMEREINNIAFAGNISDDVITCDRVLKKTRVDRGCTAKERISRMLPSTAGKRSSIYRGVTRHRWTGRYEAHLWDKGTWNQNQNKKGKQVYLGAYDEEEAAARAYDLAALKYWGPGTQINFPVTDYARDIEEMKNLPREDYLASLRRKSSGFSRGIPKISGDIDISTNNMVTGRRIDLTAHIKWWRLNPLNLKQASIDDEVGSLVNAVGPTERYQLPSLGTCYEGRTGSSALAVLLRSSAYKCLQHGLIAKREANMKRVGDEKVEVLPSESEELSSCSAVSARPLHPLPPELVCWHPTFAPHGLLVPPLPAPVLSPTHGGSVECHNPDAVPKMW